MITMKLLKKDFIDKFPFDLFRSDIFYKEFDKFYILGILIVPRDIKELTMKELVEHKKILERVREEEVTIEDVVEHINNLQKRVGIEIYPKMIPRADLERYPEVRDIVTVGTISWRELDWIRYRGLLWLYKEISRRM